MTDDTLSPFDLPAAALAAVIDNGVRQAAGKERPHSSIIATRLRRRSTFPRVPKDALGAGSHYKALHPRPSRPPWSQA